MAIYTQMIFAVNLYDLRPKKMYGILHNLNRSLVCVFPPPQAQFPHNRQWMPTRAAPRHHYQAESQLIPKAMAQQVFRYSQNLCYQTS